MTTRLRAFAAAALLAFAAGGCVVHRLPSALSDEERTTLASCRGSGGTCVLIGAGIPVSMLEPLRETGFFESVSQVHWAGDIPRADWYITRNSTTQKGKSVGPHGGGAEFFVSLLTLGIVPIVRTGDRQMRYVLSRTPGGITRVLSWDEPAFAIAGWLAMPLAPLPGMVAEGDGFDRSDAVGRRDAERLAFELCRRGVLGRP